MNICHHCLDPDSNGTVSIRTTVRGRDEIRVCLCDKCYEIFVDRMKQAAVDAGRRGYVLTAGRIRSYVASFLLWIVRLLMKPSRW
jgi:hypothetical protein